MSPPSEPDPTFSQRAAQWREYWRAKPPAVRGMLYAAGAGLVFSVLNALMRLLTIDLNPMQSQFLRYAFGLAVLVGNTIGMGILRTPGEVAARVPSTTWFLLVWVLGACYALLGALTVSELATLRPQGHIQPDHGAQRR